MRTITLPQSDTTPAVRIVFNYRFGQRFQSLGLRGLRYNKIRDGGVADADDFLYTRDCFSPSAVETAVTRYAAPGRSVKSFIFCDVQIGRYGFGGLSFCFTGDIYNRQTGERLALRRALAQLEQQAVKTGISLSAAVRKQVWEAWLASYRAAAREWTMPVPAQADPAPQVKTPKPPTDPVALTATLLAFLADLPELPSTPGLRRSPFSF